MVEVDVIVDPCVMSERVRLLVSRDVLMHWWSIGLRVVQQNSAIQSDNTIRTVAGWGLPGGITTGRGVCC